MRSNFETSISVIAEVIAYSYNNQPTINSENPEPNKNNFDAEALITYNNKLYIFTKNWVDQKTHIYMSCLKPQEVFQSIK